MLSRFTSLMSAYTRRFRNAKRRGRLALGCLPLFGICVLCGMIQSVGQSAGLIAIAPTRTPAPTATPRPTQTPVPTEAPTVVPTATMQPTTAPTDVPTVEPTTEPTTEPTSQPAGEVAAAPLNISREALQSVYEGSLYGFTFESATPVNGQPRVMGSSRNNLGNIELIGPPENLQKASLLIGVTSDDQAANEANALSMLTLVKTVAPDWQGAPTWMNESLQSTIDSGEEVTMVQGDKQFTLVAHKSLGMIVLTAEGAQ